jgi:predicted metal-dependent hydrolase
VSIIAPLKLRNQASEQASTYQTAITCWHDAEDFRWSVRHWATHIGVKVNQLHLRTMKTKWASMSTAGRLTLNTELLSLPKHLGEFVIVHELVHLLVPNHGRVFKAFMYAYLPDWEEREQELQSTVKSRTLRRKTRN